MKDLWPVSLGVVGVTEVLEEGMRNGSQDNDTDTNNGIEGIKASGCKHEHTKQLRQDNTRMHDGDIEPSSPGYLMDVS